MVACKFVEIKCKTDERGKLSFVQNSQLPFTIQRVFWITSMKNKERGAHAHYETRQCMICIMGKCKVTLDDGKSREIVILEDNNKGLLIEPHYWHTMSEFSPDCLLLVLASKEYDEKDYIRGYDKFKQTCAK